MGKDPKEPDDRYYELPGPGKADKHPNKTTKFDRYDWGRNSEPEQLFSPPNKKGR